MSGSCRPSVFGRGGEGEIPFRCGREKTESGKGPIATCSPKMATSFGLKFDYEDFTYLSSTFLSFDR